MSLNVSKGNMYDFITHTWNPIKGKCPHDCSYCYMKRWGEQKPLRLDQKEMQTDLGSSNFIFVGSSTDMFAWDVDAPWIVSVLKHMKDFNNSYLLQSKNPYGFLEFGYLMPENTVVCTTIETNRFYPDIMNHAPIPYRRSDAMRELYVDGYENYVTIEPIMKFDLQEMIEIISECRPKQVNIGADSGGNGLPEPTKNEVLELIEGLKGFTTIHKKSNLERLIR